jgi:hypothetical protein
VQLYVIFLDFLSQAEAELQEYEQLGVDFDQVVQEYAKLQVRVRIALGALPCSLAGTFQGLARSTGRVMDCWIVCSCDDDRQSDVLHDGMCSNA